MIDRIRWGKFVAIGVFLMLPAGARAEGEVQAVRTFELPHGGTLDLPVPAGWRSETEADKGNGVVTLKFSPAEGEAFGVLISPLVKPSGKRGEADLRLLRGLIDGEAAGTGPGTVEKKLTVREIVTEPVHLFYYVATDAAPKPGEFEYMARAWADAGSLVLHMTVLTHVKEAPEIAQALSMLGGAVHHPGQAAAPAAGAAGAAGASGAAGTSGVAGAGGRQELRLPGSAWALTLDLPGHELTARDTTDDGRTTMLMGNNDRTGLIVSAFLEREEKPLTSAQCRDKYFGKVSKSPTPKTGIKTYESEALDLGEYTLIPDGKKGTRYRNVHGYLGVDDVCVDVHISKSGATAEDADLFTAVLDSVAVRRD